MHPTANQVELIAAYQRGGVDPHIAGGDRYEVFRSVVQRLPALPGVDRQWLLDCLLAYENSGGVPIGDGIAIPPARYPLVVPNQEPFLRVCYLEQPLDFSASDGIPVGVIFFLICSTVDQYHQRLSQLTSALQVGELRQAAKRHADAASLLAAFQHVNTAHSISPCATSPWPTPSGVQ